MPQDSDFKYKAVNNTSNKSLNSEATIAQNSTYLLKLVVSNPEPIQAAPVSSQLTPSNVGFMVKTRKIGPQIYEMSIRDPFHDLGCDLILDIEESRGKTVAVCHFPVILNEPNKFLHEDEDLYGIIVVQFQMKVLDQLFLFCTDQGASQLTIYMDDAQAEGFGIYKKFLVHCDETLTENGEKTEIIVPTDQENFEKWRNFMKKTSHGFEQDLWREQQLNPAIRHYLKSRAHG